MKRILIVEDDEKLRKEIEIFLKHNGYEAEFLEDFSNTVNDILESKSDLVLLDINLPGADGEYVCREVRKKSMIPIIIITSRNNELDELLSIQNGADYYVTKPFNIQILLAKIASVLNRSKLGGIQEKIDCGEFILNISKSYLEKEEQKIELTKNEFKIMKYLIEHRGKIVSRDEIMDFLWETDCFIDDNTLTVNMTRLRKKLEELKLNDLIETKRGQGYMLKEEEK